MKYDGSFAGALAWLFLGGCVLRKSWGKDWEWDYIVMCDGDKVTPRGLYSFDGDLLMPWAPTDADLAARDWGRS